MGKSDAIPATSGRIQNTHVVHEALFLFSVDDRTNTFLSQHLSTPNFGKVQSLFPVSESRSIISGSLAEQGDDV